MENLVVWVADVGSVQKDRFGYCSLDQAGRVRYTGIDPREFANGIIQDLRDERRVALGFECPLFIPVRAEPKELTKGRTVDGNRAWSAEAGSGVLATGLVECAWVLWEIGKAQIGTRPTLDGEVFRSSHANLFIWEAFVSGKAKHYTVQHDLKAHIGDAMNAAETFLRKFENGEMKDQKDGPVLSLAGAALLYAGLIKDPAILRQPCPVFKP